MELYIPEVLVKKLGQDAVMGLLNSPELAAYRNAMITKKAASMAFYKHSLFWDTFLKDAETDIISAVKGIFD